MAPKNIINRLSATVGVSRKGQGMHLYVFVAYGHRTGTYIP